MASSADGDRRRSATRRHRLMPNHLFYICPARSSPSNSREAANHRKADLGHRLIQGDAAVSAFEVSMLRSDRPGGIQSFHGIHTPEPGGCRYQENSARNRPILRLSRPSTVASDPSPDPHTTSHLRISCAVAQRPWTLLSRQLFITCSTATA
jgi:hypothetical protein